MKRGVWVVAVGLLVLVAAPASASESSVLVTADLTSMWQGYSVTLDGQQADGQASNQPKQFVDVYPGRHEIVVEIWTSPFKHSTACQGFVDVPRHAEIRVKCAGRRLVVYGGTKLKDEVDVRREEERGERHEKRKLLRQALRDLLDDASDEVRECRRAVVKPVQSIMDRTDDRHPEWRRILRKVRAAAEDAADDCPRSIVHRFENVRAVLEDLSDDD
jgi:hypothetical protein